MLDGDRKQKPLPIALHIPLVKSGNRGLERRLAYANTPFAENEAAISPDGHWMAYTSNETGRPEVYVSAFPVPGARYLVSANGGRAAAWTADSRSISFATVSGEYVRVSFTPGNPPAFGPQRCCTGAASRGIGRSHRTESVSWSSIPRV